MFFCLVFSIQKKIYVFVFLCHEKVPLNALFSIVFFCASVDLVDLCSEKREGEGR